MFYYYYYYYYLLLFINYLLQVCVFSSMVKVQILRPGPPLLCVNLFKKFILKLLSRPNNHHQAKENGQRQRCLANNLKSIGRATLPKMDRYRELRQAIHLVYIIQLVDFVCAAGFFVCVVPFGIAIYFRYSMIQPSEQLDIGPKANLLLLLFLIQCHIFVELERLVEV